MVKIVCVEDETHIREAIVEELTDAGHDVVAVANGEEGLRAILRHEPDLVLCDCLMPVMTGGLLLTELRAHYPQFDEMPFVFLSAHAGESHVKDGLAQGADAYLTKPVDWGLLFETIEAVLKRKGKR